MLKYLVRIPVPFSRKQKKVDYGKYREALRYIHAVGEGISREIRKDGNLTREELRSGFGMLRHGQVEINNSIIRQTHVIQRGLNNIDVTLEEGFEGLAHGLQIVGEELSEQLSGVQREIVATGDRLAKGLGELRASFDMGMMNIVSQFELQRAEIQVGFEKIAHFLANSRKLEAQERYKDGKVEYEKYLRFPEELQFLSDALEYLRKSSDIYKGNPFCHFYLGHIYQEPSPHYNLELARKHYQLCATYAKGIDNVELAALGYFMAAWIAYVLGDVDDAIELSKHSLDYDGERNGEAYFNLAKYYAYKGDAESALVYLDVAIQRFDPLYTVKADVDLDFEGIREALEGYFGVIRDAEARLLDDKLQHFGLLPERFD